MFGHLFFLDWSGRNTDANERMVLCSVAVKALQSDDEPKKIFFTHQYCDGLLIRKGVGVFGAIPGTIFHAVLDEIDGSPRTVTFLLSAGSEEYAFKPGMVALSIDPIITDEGPHLRLQEVEMDDNAMVHPLN